MPKPFKSRIIVPYKHIQPPTDPIPEHEKAAFITHMNTNWRLELRHLVVLHPTSTGIPEEYNSPARRNEEDPLLTDINYRGMTLYLPSTDSTHIVPFSPPLRSWADRRTRVADMAARARESMDIWEDGTVGLVVEEYAKPRVPYDAVVFGAVLFYYCCFAGVKMGLFEEGGLLARGVEMVRFPFGVEGFRWLVMAIFAPVVGIHLTEAFWMDRSRLRKYGVKRGSKWWWLWMGSVFIEGAMAFKRFDIIVERMRVEREKKW